MTDEERSALAGEYVLGTLDAAERAEVERALPGDPALAAEIRQWERRLAPLAVSTPEGTSPPPSAWYAIESRLPQSAQRADPAGGAEIIEMRRKVGIWRTATIAVTALAAALALTIFLGPTLNDQIAGEQFLAVVDREGAAPAILVNVDTGIGIVTAQSLAAEAPPERSLELWYIGEGQQPLSLGVMDEVGARIQVATADIANFNPDGAVFAITDEPRGGSPTGDPTGDVVFQGRLVRAIF